MTHYMTVALAARKLGVTYYRLYRAVRFREVPACEIGRRWFINPDDLGTIREYFAGVDAR